MVNLSAIVSAYYAADYLSPRLWNLTKLGVSDIIVVCQEGSEEQKIAMEHTCTVVITNDIPTVYKAWNLGIQHAVEEFVTNANSDDVVYEKGYEHLVDLLQNNPDVCLAYGNSDILNIYKGYPINRFQWYQGGLEDLLEHCFIGPMPVWRRSLHEKYGFFDEEMRSAGDYEFWLRLAFAGEKFLHTKRCVGAFLSHSDSASMREPLRSIWETARARSRYNKQGVI